MFTPLGLNYTHNTCTVTNHLLDIPQRQTTYYGTYSMISIASTAWNNLQRNTIKNLLECKFSEFKKIIFQTYHAKYCNQSPTNLLQLYLTKTLYTTNSQIFYVYFSFCFFFFLFISSSSIVIIIPSSFFDTETYHRNFSSALLLDGVYEHCMLRNCC